MVSEAAYHPVRSYAVFLVCVIMKAKIIATLYINKKAMLSQGNRAMPL